MTGAVATGGNGSFPDSDGLQVITMELLVMLSRVGFSTDIGWKHDH